MCEEKLIHRFFLDDELLAGAARKHGLPDLDIYGKRGPLLALIEAVVSQQLSDKAARAIFARLENLISGESPGAVSLGRAGKEKLREAGISGSKAETIICICRLVESGGLDLDRLAAMDDHAVKEELTRIKGIGEWTAQMHLIFGLKRKDVWPSTDLGIRRNLSALLKKKKMMEAEKVEAYGRRWAPFRSYAAIYLWKG